MSESDPFEDVILVRVRESAPLVPEDVLSPTGTTAQRVFVRATATSRSDIGRRYCSRAATRSPEAPWWGWRGRRRIGAVGVATVLAAVVAVLVSLGGGATIVQRAYAATNPAGVIVHYVETTVGPAAADRQKVTYWLYGLDSRQIISVDDNKPKYRQDIVTSGGLSRNLGLGKLVVTPTGPVPSRCAPAIVLIGDCAGIPTATPLNGLRSLYRSGRMHLAGYTTASTRRLDVLVGSIHSGVIGELKVRALVDAHTFAPARVTITDALPSGNAKTAIVTLLTITHYQRLPVTPRTIKLLALPAHPGVPVIRFHACPTKKRPNKLCR